MKALAAQQQALLEALIAWPAQQASQHLLSMANGVGGHPQRGLKAYQSNAHALAERALQAAFPVLAQILGSQSFAELARDFWHQQPPQRGDIAQWGRGLADFVRGSAQLQDVPYLADVAWSEWAMHCSQVASNAEADLGSLALLTTQDPASLVFCLAPGLAAYSSDWPLASILLAHLQGSPDFAEVARMLQSRTPQDVVLWRSGYETKVRQALPGECKFLRALLAGQAVEPALEAAATLDFSQWLPLAVQTGLVLGARHAAPATPADVQSG
jgi:hypothetical protein